MMFFELFLLRKILRSSLGSSEFFWVKIARRTPPIITIFTSHSHLAYVFSFNNKYNIIPLKTTKFAVFYLQSLEADKKKKEKLSIRHWYRSIKKGAAKNATINLSLIELQFLFLKNVIASVSLKLLSFVSHFGVLPLHFRQLAQVIIRKWTHEEIQPPDKIEWQTARQL